MSVAFIESDTSMATITVAFCCGVRTMAARRAIATTSELKEYNTRAR